MNYIKMLFNIDDFGEVIEIKPAVKRKVGKHSKVYQVLSKTVKRRVRNYRKLTEVEKDMIVYINEGHEVDQETAELVAANDILSASYNSIMIDRIVNTVMTKGIFTADSSFDVKKHQKMDIFDASEHWFFDHVLSGIKSEDHPLYAIYKIKNNLNLLTKIIIYAPRNANLNWLDVSKLKDFSWTFYNSDFRGDVSLWHLDSAESTYSMFDYSDFDGDISKWRFPKLKNASYMFSNSKFNGDISEWEFPRVQTMASMFYSSKFNGDISRWKFPKVTDMSDMFKDSMFKGDMPRWEFPNVVNMKNMFERATIKSDISGWKFPKVTSMVSMFSNTVIKTDISGWKFPKVTDMSYMFANATIQTDMSKWKFPKVNNMYAMFECAHLKNVNIGGWKFHKVTEIEYMLYSADFDEDISGWKIPSVCRAYRIFWNSKISDNHLPAKFRKGGQS